MVGIRQDSRWTTRAIRAEKIRKEFQTLTC
jgi:hypothetical protein